MNRLFVLVAACSLVVTAGVSARALASESDPSALYEVTTDGTSQTVKAGQKGTVVISIKVKDKKAAHVSDDAPLKIELSSDKVKVDKAKLSMADSVTKKAPGQQYAEPRFEVPFSATTAGKGAIDAKMTFFICTETQCARQQKTLSVPVQVE